MSIVKDIADHLVSAKWHAFETDFTVFSEGGEAISGAVMRRRVAHSVQYRTMTEQELVVFEDRFRFY